MSSSLYDSQYGSTVEEQNRRLSDYFHVPATLAWFWKMEKEAGNADKFTGIYTHKIRHKTESDKMVTVHIR